MAAEMTRSALQAALGVVEAFEALIHDMPEIGRLVPGLPGVKKLIEAALASPAAGRRTVALDLEALRQHLRLCESYFHDEHGTSCPGAGTPVCSPELDWLRAALAAAEKEGA